jgi:hypothetical protein
MGGVSSCISRRHETEHQEGPGDSGRHCYQGQELPMMAAGNSEVAQRYMG